MKYKSVTDGDDIKARRQELVNKAVASKDKEALEWMLGNRHGRWFLARLMQTEGFTTRSFTGNSATFYNEGRREVCVGIYETILTQMKLRGIKLLHQAQEELLEYKEKVKSMAEDKEDNNG